MNATHTQFRAGRRHRRPLAVAFVLVLGFVVIEWAAGVMAGSLSLISDAGHMATDALGLGIAMAAIGAADRADTGAGRTYGFYRLEILAALANAGLLLLVGGYVLIEAVRRFQEPIAVLAGPMLLVAVGGLLVNVIAWRLLRSGAEESINVRGAYYEVVADLIGSIGVIAAAVITMTTGWRHTDPLFAALIGLFILPRAWQLGRQALRVLVQAAPDGVDVESLRSDLCDIDGVVDVHDLHVWTLTSEMDVATVHLMTSSGVAVHPVLDQARSVLRDSYRIDHATLQVEPDTHVGCSDVAW
jgi:cobalt-zinc-cadmium efflux system protein